MADGGVGFDYYERWIEIHTAGLYGAVCAGGEATGGALAQVYDRAAAGGQ